MKTIIKNIFIDIYADDMKNLGFQRKGSIFHRLVNNEILQFLNYRTYAGDVKSQYSLHSFHVVNL